MLNSLQIVRDLFAPPTTSFWLDKIDDKEELLYFLADSVVGLSHIVSLMAQDLAARNHITVQEELELWDLRLTHLIKDKE